MASQGLFGWLPCKRSPVCGLSVEGGSIAKPETGCCPWDDALRTDVGPLSSAMALTVSIDPNSNLGACGMGSP